MDANLDVEKGWVGVELAVEGAGVSPQAVDARDAIEVVAAMVSLLEAAAEERRVKLPKGAFRLLGVFPGSQHFVVVSPYVAARDVAAHAHHLMSTRGDGARPRARAALTRLKKATDTAGTIDGRAADGMARFRVIGTSQGENVWRETIVDSPKPPSNLPYENVTEIYGKVIGVNRSRDDLARVTIELDGGGTQDFLADENVGALAGKLYNRGVRAVAVYEIAGDVETPVALEEISAWQNAGRDVLAYFDRVRGELAAEGVHVRASDWLDDLERERAGDDEDGALTANGRAGSAQ